MKRAPKTLKQLTQDLGQTFESEEAVSLIASIDNEEVFRAMYKQRIQGSPEEEQAREIVSILKNCANKGTDIQAHVESLIRFEK